MTKALVSGSGLAIAAIVSTALVSRVQARAADCAGNACGSISMKWTGACYEATNTGSRNVKVEVRPVGGIASSISKVLKPGDKWTPILVYTRACLKGYVAPYQANFEATAQRRPHAYDSGNESRASRGGPGDMGR